MPLPRGFFLGVGRAGGIMDLVARLFDKSIATYAYDANKNLDTATAGGVMSGYSFTTTQDAEDRLTQWARTNAESQSFGLSFVGDWNTYGGDRLENGVLTAFNETRQHNDVHEILEIDDGTIKPLEHDANGNLTLDEEGNTYVWDFDNRLKEVQDSNGDLVASFTYDALGRRVTKTAPAPGSGPSVLTAFVHLTDDSGMGQLLAEYETNALKRQYTYGAYIDEPLTLTNYDAGLPGGEETLWYHRDRQYNLVGLTDSSGGVVERYAYGPYGERRVLDPDGITVRQTSAVGNPIGHQGLYHDDETNLIYNRARYRDARLGRWLGRDPLEYAGGLNLYQFIKSQSFNYLDPTGLFQWYVIRGRATNESDDRCAIVWSDFDGPWKGFQLLGPGDDTGGFPMKDQNDYMYFNGKWYKNRSQHIFINQDRDYPFNKSPFAPGHNDHTPIKPVDKDDDTKAPGKKGWKNLPSEDLCRQYCECNNQSENPTSDCDDVDDCIKKCRNPWGDDD
ncbi:MAG: RHS repeat-associated core domain-containing protein [Planctomycetota bacterium]